MKYILFPKQHPKCGTIIPGVSEAELPQSYLAQQCLSLELSSPAELFNKHEILQVSIKGNIMQPHLHNGIVNHPTFSQTLKLIAAS